LEEVGLIDDQEDGLAGLLFGFKERLLDLVVDGTFGKPGGEPQESIDMIEEIGPGEGGKRGIKGLEEVFVEGIDKTSHGQGLTNSGITGKQEDTSSAFDVIQTGQTFFKRIGRKQIGRFDSLIKREVFETEPGQEILHERTLP
jgi:hypothetical protein